MLGFVSLFMDVSSELIHGLLPVFMVSSLGATAFAVGIVEGVAEATALIVKVFSGVLSDYIGKRKILAVIGYGLGAISKPLFPLALTRGLGVRRALHRPHRQGHTRCSARRAGRRSGASGDTRRGLTACASRWTP